MSIIYVFHVLTGDSRNLHQECYTSQRLRRGRDSNLTYIMRADHEFYCTNMEPINHKVTLNTQRHFMKDVTFMATASCNTEKIPTTCLKKLITQLLAPRASPNVTKSFFNIYVLYFLKGQYWVKTTFLSFVSCYNVPHQKHT